MLSHSSAVDIMRPTVIAVAAVVLFSHSSLLLLKSLNKSITVVYDCCCWCYFVVTFVVYAFADGIIVIAVVVIK